VFVIAGATVDGADADRGRRGGILPARGPSWTRSAAGGDHRLDVLAALAKLEPERLGLCLPMLDEVAESCVALGTEGPKGCQLHPFGRAVAVNSGGLLDRLAPLGKGPLDIARDSRDPERIGLPLKANALALQL